MAFFRPIKKSVICYKYVIKFNLYKDLFKEEWFVKEILPNQAENNEKNSETTSQCNIQTLLSFNPSLLFNLSVKVK